MQTKRAHRLWRATTPTTRLATVPRRSGARAGRPPCLRMGKRLGLIAPAECARCNCPLSTSGI
eukprot:11221291-Lingulodinium_polyedra.AAC.1